MNPFLARHPLIQHGGLIFLAQILLVLLVPLVDDGALHTPVVMYVGAIAASTLTVLLLGYRKPALILVAIGGLAVVALLVRSDTLAIRFVGTIVLIVAYLWSSSLCIQHAFAGAIPASQRILCGAASFIMLGFVFAVLHTLLGVASPGAYVLSAALEGGRPPRWIDFIWLSFSTITTAGYGDLAPVGRWASALCTLEALCGILFPATLIARIASLPATPATSQPSSTRP
jgi:hypothetical protein